MSAEPEPMRVSKLIALLRMMPQNAKVAYFWDGAARSYANRIWLAVSGDVVIGDRYTMPGQTDDPALENNMHAEDSVMPGHWSNL